MQISLIRNLRVPLNISSWFVFTVSLIIYWLTADSSGSYWDSPEYVVTASRLEIGHPPGNPLWTLAMRVVTSPFPETLHAYVINLSSGLITAFATFFLCRVIYVGVSLFFRKYLKRKNSAVGHLRLIPMFVAAGASLCFSFCDSVWYSAVEAEVYAMSAMLLSLMLWILVCWWFEREKPKQRQWLILIAYLEGLSTGVHELNLLIVPVIIFVIICRLQPRKIKFSYFVLWLLISLLTLGFVLKGVMEGIPKAASQFELFFVNGLGLGYNSGLIFFIISLFLLLGIAIVFSRRKKIINIETSLWGIGFMILGYCSFALIMIRGAASPPMNEGAPGDIFALTSYINRDQYPKTPLIYGQTPYSMPMFVEEDNDSVKKYRHYALKKEGKKYSKKLSEPLLSYRSGFPDAEDSMTNEKIMNSNGHGYLLSDYSYSQILTPELNMWVPRITSRNFKDREAYTDWTGMNEKTMEKVKISEAFDREGNVVAKMDASGKRGEKFSYRPTYLQNVTFFLTYQTYYMYLRYLLWNFVGKQNDFHSTGEIEHGNFITGIDLIDNLMLGAQDKIPPEAGKENPGRNTYYGIPFILGIIGIVGLALGKRNGKRILFITFLLFLMTGIAIVVYLNQGPSEPRERDYSFLGSYMAFSIWISAGLLLICRFLISHIRVIPAIFCSLIVCFGPCTLMALENYDDHDRRGRFETGFFASGILDYEIPSVIFSHGDNSTFPLWYGQEVEGLGDKHAVLDLSYLNMPSYIVNMMKQGDRGINFSFEPREIMYDAYAMVRIPAESISPPLPLGEALQRLREKKESSPVFPSSSVFVRHTDEDSVRINLRDLTGGSSYLSFRQLILLDIINSTGEGKDRKILYFPNVVTHSFYKTFDGILKPALFGKIYSPSVSDSVAIELLAGEADRELKKLDDLDFTGHYMDPIVADQVRRYRGALVMGAEELLKNGDLTRAINIAKKIDEKLPYEKILPGDFTIADSTYFEGEKFLLLLNRLHDITDKEEFGAKAERISRLLKERGEQWTEYYLSLSKDQRKTLSSRSLRIIGSKNRLEKSLKHDSLGE